MAFHDFFSSGAVNVRAVASGTFINTETNGTAAAYPAFNHEYHAAVFVGTIANDGTILVFGADAATPVGTALLGTVNVGSSNGLGVFEFKTDTLTNLGTQYTHWTAQIKVNAGGTWRGALLLQDHQPRNAGTTPAANGIASLGTLYY